MAHMINVFWRRIIYVALGAFIIVGGLCGAWAYDLHLTGNIHEVEPGIVYRSGQLSAEEIAGLIQARHIKAVLNLRGDNSGSDWYEAEEKIVQQSGARFINLKMSAIREPDPALTASLIQTLKAAPTPLLIHCKDGADRTGLAAALYELTVMHRNPLEADAQLSFRYGHFPWLTSHTGAMDDAFWRYVSTLPSFQYRESEEDDD